MIRKRLLHLVPICLLACLCACAPSRYVRPLAPGEVAVSGTYGGPLFKNFGIPIPAPMITVGAGYGWKENTTLYADWHVTSAMFGVIQADLGASHGFLRPQGARPGLSGSAAVNVAGDVWEGGFKAWPQLDANAYWEYGQKKHYGYLGLSTWWELRALDPAPDDQIRLILPGLQLGNVFAGRSWDKTIEVKWNNFARNSRDATVDWSSIGQLGAVGIHIGLTKRF
jgi:hypothetical protein